MTERTYERHYLIWWGNAVGWDVNTGILISITLYTCDVCGKVATHICDSHVRFWEPSKRLNTGRHPEKLRSAYCQEHYQPPRLIDKVLHFVPTKLGYVYEESPVLIKDNLRR